MPFYDKFDIVDAHYWWNADHHEGQGSKGYARLSRLSSIFEPSCLAHGATSENAIAIYDELCSREGCTHE